MLKVYVHYEDAQVSLLDYYFNYYYYHKKCLLVIKWLEWKPLTQKVYYT